MSRPSLFRSLLLTLPIATGATGTVFSASPAQAAEAQGDALRKDLLTVITLEGLPCGAVKKAERRAENDYDVTCRSGDRYRVFISQKDRVVIEKR